MTQINYWLKAPEWANAVIASKDGQEFYVSQFGGISARQRVGYSEVDHDLSADMIEPHNWSLIATRQTPWTGEGLPPVGTVCEFLKHNSPPAPEGQWTVGDIRYVSDCTVIIGGDKCEHVHHPRNCSFRPIRTPEQIAAEERLKTIDEMAAVYKSNYEGHVKDGCQALYDAGYRKVEVKP